LTIPVVIGPISMVMAGTWQSDRASFSFRPAGHDGHCFVHQRAFGTILGRASLPAECEQYFHTHSSAFQQAAAAKIKRARLASHENFHLNSRDILRELRPRSGNGRFAVIP